VLRQPSNFLLEYSAGTLNGYSRYSSETGGFN